MRHLLGWIFIAAFIIRIGVLMQAGDEALLPDSIHFDRIAANILAGNGTISSPEKMVLRMPGYPYFLAFFKGLASSYPKYVIAVQVAQALLESLVVVILFVIGSRLFPPPYFWLPAVALALNPLHIIFPAFLLSEPLFTFLLAFSLFLLFQTFTNPSRENVFWAAVFMSATLYVKESVLLLPLFLMVGFFFSKNSRSYSLIAGKIFILMVLFLSPWIMRNHLMTGQMIFTTTHGGVTLYDSVNPDADGSSNYFKFINKVNMNIKGEKQIDDWWYQKSLEAMRQDPERIAKLALVKARRFWSPFINADEYQRPVMNIFFGLYYIPLFFFFIIGCFSKDTYKNPILLTCFLTILYFALLHMLFVGSLRYRMPIEPFVLLIAAVGFMRVFPFKKKEDGKPENP